MSFSTNTTLCSGDNRFSASCKAASSSDRSSAAPGRLSSDGSGGSMAPSPSRPLSRLTSARRSRLALIAVLNAMRYSHV